MGASVFSVVGTVLSFAGALTESSFLVLVLVACFDAEATAPCRLGELCGGTGVVGVELGARSTAGPAGALAPAAAVEVTSLNALGAVAALDAVASAEAERCE